MTDDGKYFFQFPPLAAVIDLPGVTPEMKTSAMNEEMFQVVVQQTEDVRRKARSAPETQVLQPSPFEQVFEVGEPAVFVHLQRGGQCARRRVRGKELGGTNHLESRLIDQAKMPAREFSEGRAEADGGLSQQRPEPIIATLYLFPGLLLRQPF